jgi:hypothetical protein
VRNERGTVALEWVAATALLLLPVVVLVATLPAWAERRHAAVVAAREAVTVLARDWPAADEERVVRVAREVLADHGVAPAEVEVRIRAIGVGRGDAARVDVVVVMPAISVAGIEAGAWHYTARATRRIDDYRSR